jgi:hypothetical protein
LVLMTLEQRIDEAVAAPAAPLLCLFYGPRGRFAGSTFDEVGENPPYSISPADLVAVSLLDVRFEPRAVRAMSQTEAERLATLLRPVPASVDLWAAEDRHLDVADVLFQALDIYPGVGETKASKLLARKRDYCLLSTVSFAAVCIWATNPFARCVRHLHHRYEERRSSRFVHGTYRPQ